MGAEQNKPRARNRARAVRFVIYLLVLLAVVAWRFFPRPWKPALTIETPHYRIASSATRMQTEEIGRVAECLYATYSSELGTLPGVQREHPRLKLLLYKDRKEFRWINPGLGWAEAFYRPPCCRAYFAADEVNPYHWMLHEAVHQLNQEVGQLHLARWLEEGLAEYFSTSRLTTNGLALGRIDPNTYPVWWMSEIATTPDLKTNLANGSVIPLRAIITNQGGPSLNQEFNLYYLHWWTLTYFIFEHEKHRGSAMTLVQRGGDLESFEQLIGPVETVQVEWHEYVRRMRAALSGQDMEFLRNIGSQSSPAGPR